MVPNSHPGKLSSSHCSSVNSAQQMHPSEACKYTCRGRLQPWVWSYKPACPLQMVAQISTAGKAKLTLALLACPRGSANQPDWNPFLWKFLQHSGSTPSFSCLIPGITFKWLHYQVTFLSQAPGVEFNLFGISLWQASSNKLHFLPVETFLFWSWQAVPFTQQCKHIHSSQKIKKLYQN